MIVNDAGFSSTHTAVACVEKTIVESPCCELYMQEILKRTRIHHPDFKGFISSRKGNVLLIVVSTPTL